MRIRRNGLVVIVAALMSLLAPLAVADEASPSPSPSASPQTLSPEEQAIIRVQLELQQLETEAYAVQERINASQDKLDTAQRNLSNAKADLADQEAKVEDMTAQVGLVATAAHQRNATADVVKMFLRAPNEESFLADLAVMQSVSAITDEQLYRFLSEQERLAEIKQEQDEAVATINEELDKQKALKAEYDEKISSARAAVGGLSSEQLAELERRMNAAALSSSNAEILGIDAASLADPASLPKLGDKPVLPAAGPLTSPFGYRTNPIGGHSELHDGLDIGAPCAAPIRAAWAGVIAQAGPAGGWGNRVILDSGVYKSRYAHMSVIVVRPGQFVKAGEIIGAVGTTGYSTGCHLHFSVWENGTLIDPATLL